MLACLIVYLHLQSHTRCIQFKYRCGESLDDKRFYLLLYSDPYRFCLHEVWCVWVRPMQRCVSTVVCRVAL